MSRRDEYRHYLTTDTWKQKRDRVLQRANHRCEHCHEPATAVHHVRYPKALGTETERDLIAICDRCHDLNHGKGMMDTLKDPRAIERMSPSGLSFRCLDSEGRVYASLQSWAGALGWPKNEMAQFGVLVENQARKRPSWSAHYQGTTVYRWHAVEDALLTFYVRYDKASYRHLGPIEQQQYENLYRNYEAIRDWGRDLQEREIGGAIQSGTSISPAASPTELIARALQMLAPKVDEHDLKLERHEAVLIEHEKKISSIAGSAPIQRDRQAWITVKQGILELGLDPSVLPIHGLKWNLAQVAAQRLMEAGAELGTQVSARLDGSSIIVPMNTYRRGAVYDILLALTGEAKRH